MNETNALIALGFLLLLVGTLTSLQALLEVLEGMVELFTLLEIDSDDLVNSNKLLRDGLFQVGKPVSHTVLVSCLHVVHGLEDIEDLLLADTETLQSVDLSCGVLVLDGDIEASLVEVRGGLPIVKLLELLCDLGILLQALLDVLVVLTVALTLVVLSLLQVVAERQQRVLALVKSCLPSSLVQPLLLLKLDRWLNFTWGSVRCNVEKVNVGLQVALLKESDSLALSADLLLKLEVVLLSKVLAS